MNLLSKTKRYFHTVRYLKAIQVFYRIKYALIPIKNLNKSDFNGSVHEDFTLVPLPGQKKITTVKDGTYSIKLLNQEKVFQSKINWSYDAFDRLWNYNLQYADFLNQNDLPVSVREDLILDLLSWLYDGKLLPEPYPASLRIMNTIRFLHEHVEPIQKTDLLLNGLYSELQFLSNRLEYHLLGNHLLENAFALLMGGTFLNQKKWADLGEKILEDQLDEQILDDGAHFERSPMYHQTILFRVLEAISYLSGHSDVKNVLKSSASKMVSWLKTMTFNDGSTAHFNDSVDGQSYSTGDLIGIANKYGADTELHLEMSDSGFRKFSSKTAELIIDVDGIKPEYQPGHAHADSLSFVLSLHGKPFIVDPAISTYCPGERRNLERSTKAHNTITVNDEYSADVWSSFRVGRRPSVRILHESKNKIVAEATYCTYSGLTVEHQRSITFNNKNVLITDSVKSEKKASGRLHFAPGTNIKNITDMTIEFAENTRIIFLNIKDLKKFRYDFNTGFNQRIESFGMEYTFDDTCIIQIEAG